MIWYLLYPLRGTTESPVLPPTHPLRNAFSRYGTWVARHVQTVLPLSVAAIFFLLYPFFFLYTTDVTNITSGVGNLPHHVWTDAKPLNERVVAEPDVIMRSIWVHGSYMKALDRPVLLGALELQDELLGPTTDFNPRRPPDSRPVPGPIRDLTREERDSYHIINGLTPQSWFFHSPLQYWSGSADNITNDRDIISTVNARKTQSTSVNVTLRHSIVFSGKRFEERKLVAADALVITLIHLRDSPVGQQWVRKAESLASRLNDKWTIIPTDGKSTSNQLYEFRFELMSWRDWTMFTIAYSLTLVYLMGTLSKLRAVKSRIGLIAAILAQIAASIGSSFTICAIFKIDLSRVPSYAYPLGILAISMENSLNLINAVIVTSSTISIGDRIGEAFGATALTVVANRVQNLLLLYGASRITFPGVAAVCTFSAVAVIFDFFYMASFFLAVLSVDLRQKELIELEKASVKRHQGSQNAYSSKGLINTLRQVRLGKVTLSTRVAGTIVVFGFILIAQSHYAPESGRQWLKWIFSPRSPESAAQKSSLLVDIHQARSPTSWLRLQDHETAREVIKVVKPLAHSYVALVFDPIVFVLKGSNRTPGSGEPFFPPAVYDFVHHEIPRFVVFLLTLAAILLILTKYLLGNEFKHPGEPEHPDDEPLLSVKSLPQGHTLDVINLAVSPSGHLVSAGLDRVVQISDIPSGSTGRIISQPNNPIEDPFPILGTAIDEDSKWLALVSVDKVMLWDVEKHGWKSVMQIDLGGHRPEAVFFTTNPAHSMPSLVVIRRNGTMVEVAPDGPELKEFTICKTPLIWAVDFAESSYTTQFTVQQSILTASKRSCIHLVRRCGDSWVSLEVKLSERGNKDVHCLLPIPAYSVYLIGRSESVDMVDIDSGAIIRTFQTEPMRRGSLRQTYSSRAGQSGLTSLTLSYVNSQTDDLVIQTYSPKDDNDTIYSYNPAEPHRRLWGETTETTRCITNPGKWETLSNGRIVGVRQRSSEGARDPNGSSSPALVAATNGLRRRSSVMGDRFSNHTKKSDRNDVWEAWVIDHLGGGSKLDSPTPPLVVESTPLNEQKADGQNDAYGKDGRLQLHLHDHRYARHDYNLMVTELGPMVKLGTSSVAVGFGNVVKIISVGHEHFDRPRDRLTRDNLRNFAASSRRKRERDRERDKERDRERTAMSVSRASISIHHGGGGGLGLGLGLGQD